MISVGIGRYAGKYENDSSGYANAGRSLPMYVVTATVFATWFGSETVLGIPASFLKDGLGGVVAGLLYKTVFEEREAGRPRKR